MKELYFMIDLTKQAHHKYSKSKQSENLKYAQLMELADQVRAEHPGIGCRKMYDLLMPGFIGRDKFETLLLKNGYRVKQVKNYHRTTYSYKGYRYPNLIKGRKVNEINQLWQTDITYFPLNGKFYYIVFILDIYSKRIVGYNLSRNLFAESNIAALKMSFKLRKHGDLSKLIHHSDKGGQYYDREYLKLLSSKNVSISMCNSALENAYAERVNGIIKNEYLKLWSIADYTELEKAVKKAVKNYNYTRPHNSNLSKLSPVNYEKMLLTLSTQDKPTVTIYTDAS